MVYAGRARSINRYEFVRFVLRIKKAVRGTTLIRSRAITLPRPVFAYKLRYIVGFVLVEMAISTNPKPTIYRNLYEDTGPALQTSGNTSLRRELFELIRLRAKLGFLKKEHSLHILLH